MSAFDSPPYPYRQISNSISTNNNQWISRRKKTILIILFLILCLLLLIIVIKIYLSTKTNNNNFRITHRILSTTEKMGKRIYSFYFHLIEFILSVKNKIKNN
jgi:NADH:ubiquinone oxidoreductase subunit 6 (subunit J)